LIFRAVQRRIRLVNRSTVLSTTEEITERDFDITAPAILMIRRIFNEEQMAVNERD
jgi:hypothetical protein